jgi:hypothetical protein
MKKYILVILVAVSIASCSKDPLHEEKNEFFKSTEDLDQWVTEMYEFLNLMFNDPRGFCYYLGGDDVTSNPAMNSGHYRVFDLFAPRSEGWYGTSYTFWYSCYNSISQTSTIIMNLEKPDSNPKIPESRKQSALGQAYFVRALTNYFLTRIWGEIPLITDPNVSDYNKNASFTEIYDLIVSDLNKAESILPDNWKNDPDATELEKSTYYTRPTTGSAKALLASVYLNMAGFPLRETSNYVLAATKAKEVINNKSNYGYDLQPDFADLWLNANNVNRETVFGCFYNHLADPDGSPASLNLVCPLPYKPEDFGGGWGDIYAELTFFKKFPEGPRKNATFLTEAKNSPSEPVISWQNFTRQHPYYKKWLDVEGFSYDNMGQYIDWCSSRTMMIIRYAEVLLIYAESKAMSDGPDASAYEAINLVRNRAGLSDLVPGLTATTFRDSVINERKWEFAGNEPNSRWFDMVRTETVEEATSKRDPKETPLMNQPDISFYFAPTPP